MDADIHSADGAQTTRFLYRDVETWHAGGRRIRLHVDRFHRGGKPDEYPGSRHQYIGSAHLDGNTYFDASDANRDTDYTVWTITFHKLLILL